MLNVCRLFSLSINTIAYNIDKAIIDYPEIC